MNVDYTLNVTGLRCPEPIMLLRKKMREMEIDQTVLVLADDPASIRDIPGFCHYMEHELISEQKDNVPYQFVIKKCIK